MLDFKIDVKLISKEEKEKAPMIKREGKKIPFYRHGDLALVPVEGIPYDSIQLKTDVVELGETSGHAHQLQIAQQGAQEIEFITLEELEKARADTAKAPFEVFTQGNMAQPQNVDFISVLEDNVALTHNSIHKDGGDHEPIMLPTGDYAVLRQREWDYFGDMQRQVLD